LTIDKVVIMRDWLIRI